MCFAALSAYWTSVTFLLKGRPYEFSEAQIGLVALIGATGVLAAQAAGRLADKGWARQVTGATPALGTASFGLFFLGGTSFWALVIGIIGMDLGVQGTHILNQSTIYTLRPEARSRLTTAFMTSFFIGGPVGSAGSATVYAAFGWAGVYLLCAGFMGSCLLVWLTERPSR